MSVDRKYSCEVCGRRFGRAYALKVHLRVHTGETPYKCTSCEKAFRYREQFTHHMMYKHGITPQEIPKTIHTSLVVQRKELTDYKLQFPCNVCQRNFPTINSARSHQKLHMALETSSSDNTNSSSPSTTVTMVTGTHEKTVTEASRSPITETNNYMASNVTATGNKIECQSEIGTSCRPMDKKTGVVRIGGEIDSACHQKLDSTHDQSGNNSEDSSNQHPITQKKSTVSSDKIKSRDTVQAVSVSKRDKNNSGKRTNKNTIHETNNSGKQTDAKSAHDVKNDGKETTVESVHNIINSGEQSIEPSRPASECPECNKAFKLQGNLNRHLAFVHGIYGSRDKCSTDGLYKYHISKYSQSSLQALRRHQQPHKQMYHYQCGICHERFDSKESQTKHSKAHHKPGEPYKCLICESSYPERNALQLHVKQKHKDHAARAAANKNAHQTAKTGVKTKKPSRRVVKELPYSCPHCTWKFAYLHKLQRHVDRKHTTIADILDTDPFTADATDANGSDCFKCKQCYSSFTKEHLLCKHIMAIHWKEDDRINKINQKHSNACVQDQHIIQDNSPVPFSKSINKIEKNRFICDTCGAVYTRRNNLRDHIIKKHFDSTASEQAAQDCGIESTELSIRDHHKALNKAILKEFYPPCSLLGSPSRNPSTGVLQYMCKICLTTFTMRESFKRHVLTRAYDHGMYLRRKKQPPDVRCDVCGRMFSRTHYMIAHRQRHSEVEFKNAGLSIDTYKTNHDRRVGLTLIHVPGYGITDENEVSSSTRKNVPNIDTYERSHALEHDLITSSDTAQPEVSVYLDRAEDGDIEMECESTFFATPYVGDINDNVNIGYTCTPTYSQNTQQFGRTDAIDTTAAGIQPNYITRGEATDNNNQFVTDSNHVDYTESRNNEACSIATTGSLSSDVPDVQAVSTDEQRSDNNPNTNETMTTGIVIIDVHSNSDLSLTNQQTLTDQTERIEVDYKDVISRAGQQNRDESQCSVRMPSTANVTESSSIQNVQTVVDDTTCSSCKLVLIGKQNNLQCRLCDQLFCRHCSGLSKDVYKTLFGSVEERPNGIWWTCHVCTHVVPKYTLLLRQLGDFEHVISTRLSEMEQRVFKISKNGENDTK